MWRLILVLFGWLVWAASGLVVSAQGGEPPLPPGTEIFMQASVEGDAVVYEGEQTIYVLRIYALDRIRTRVNSVQILPAFDGFWQSTALELRNPLIEVINGVQYTVFETYVVLYPLQTGTLTIESARLEFPETALLNAEEYTSNAVRLEVLPLPEPTPQNFSGAVGQFRLETVLMPPESVLGEPLTLQLTVTGEGNLEQVPAPPLNLPDQWRVFENEATARLDSNIAGLLLWSRQYEYFLIPPRAGTVQIMPVAFHYFDPVEEQYETLSGPEYTVNVLAGEDGVLSMERLEAPPAAYMPELLPVEFEQPTTRSRPAWWMYLLPALFLATVYGVRAGNAWRKRRIAAYRQANALQRAVSSLEFAAGQREYKRIQEAIVGYCWDKLGYFPDDRGDDLSAALQHAGITTNVIKRVSELLTDVETVRYTPEVLRPSIDHLTGQIIVSLRAIDQSWRKA